MSKNKYIVFTKPWKNESLEELGALVKDMGFDGVEYPLRDGYQVQPSDGAAGIKRLVDGLGAFDLTVGSIAAGIDSEEVFAGCGENGVKIIRICQGFDRTLGFFENIDQIRRAYDAALPWCEKYGVTVGVQMHCSEGYGAFISSAAEKYILLRDYDPKYIAAVWDSGHNGLAGTEPKYGLDVIWDMLCMVNFKAAYWKARTGPEAGSASWGAYWTTGRHACGNWREAVAHLKNRGYSGVICMPAEYTDEPNAEKYTREDLAYLKELFA